ncbi:MAG TPA: D-aminoacylase, partial [Thermoanaerobaculia bacterium]|nr:D-aminoacylase [Thermoanaerobaculia bacterium]
MRSATVLLLLLACSQPRSAPPVRPTAAFDLKIAGGSIIDGTGRPRYQADIGIRGDSIAAIGDLRAADAVTTIDAKGKIVSPGFIDLLGNSEGAVLVDPNVEGKVRQGVTTEVTGEGHSPGPLDEAMAAEMNRTRPPGFPEVTWRTLGEYMAFLERRGSAINFALYVGATNPREIVLGDADRKPSEAELRRMEMIVDQAMREGAVGLTSALIYPPGRFASTEELIALAKVAGKYGGAYWTHLRNEGDAIDAALDEAFRIGREAGVPVNIFHLKLGGSRRGQMKQVVEKIEKACRSGLDVAANIYPYVATATNLTSVVPAWALEGGYLKFVERLREPDTRRRIAQELRIRD